MLEADAYKVSCLRASALLCGATCLSEQWRPLRSDLASADKARSFLQLAPAVGGLFDVVVRVRFCENRRRENVRLRLWVVTAAGSWRRGTWPVGSAALP